jgi:hypothetical protein
MKRNAAWLVSLAALTLVLAACAPVASPEIAYDPDDLRFSGERALAIETDFVTRFPDRDSGQPNNLLAAEWLVDTLGGLGLDCRIDTWEFVNYSRLVPLHNAVCVLPGLSDQEIVLTSHHDQAPTTTQGADNDGSGVGIMVHLAEILAAEGAPPYTLVFLFADAEEFGNAGTVRFLETHPDPERILAALSLDNLGKRWYEGLDMDPRGRFRGYGPVWLQRTAQEAARAAGGLWVPVMRSPVFQALEQAVPIAFMDEGTFVARGVPSFGFAGICDPDFSTVCWETYHTPQDTLDTQSAETLGQAGRVTEAVVRQLSVMQDFPREGEPYLYFEDSASVLQGAPLILVFLVPVALFVASAFLVDRRPWQEKVRTWRGAMPHYLSLWVPLAISLLLLYAMVPLGLLDEFAYYFATTKDPAWTQPRWPAIGLWLVSLVAMILVARRLAARYAPAEATPTHPASRSLAFLAIGLAAAFVCLTNPFSLLFMLPLFFWLLIRGRQGASYLLDLLFFLLGGLLIYVLIYFFGFAILHIGLYALWYLLMMFAIPMIHPAAAVPITAILAAGLSLVVRPPRPATAEARR